MNYLVKFNQSINKHQSKTKKHELYQRDSSFEQENQSET